MATDFTVLVAIRSSKITIKLVTTTFYLCIIKEVILTLKMAIKLIKTLL